MWESPDKIVKKEILELGILGSKPTDNSICTIEITNINSKSMFSEYLSDNITYPIDVIIGDSNTAVDRQIEKCISMMHQNELSYVIITLPDNDQITFNIKLNSFKFRGYIYEWTAEDKCLLAQKHKEKGIELFRDKRYKDASHRFSRALKLVLSIPIPVDVIPKNIDGVQLEEIYKLHANLYNNLASCYFKEKLYDVVIELCTKVLEIEHNVKALYKRGCSYAETKDFEKAYQDLTKLLSLDYENNAAKEKLKYVKLNINQEEAKFNSMVQKMFHT